MKICINGTVPSSAQEPVAGQGLKNSAHGQVNHVDDENDAADDDADDVANDKLMANTFKITSQSN